MELQNIDAFLSYWSKVKHRTSRLFDYIPADKIEWTYKSGRFTIGDLIRHLANIERHMYAENAQFKPSKYAGCGVEYAEGYENVISYYHAMHKESMDIFSKLTSEDVEKKCKTPAGIEITLWKWLRAMIEHESHHRGQLYLYLGALDIETPPMFGLTSEQVADSAVK